MEWEELHCSQSEDKGKEPKLLRFLGRPHDLSPLARLRSTVFGYSTPFDRHDWIVDRGGKEVRYVIDYYHDESATSADRRPSSLLDTSSMRSIALDVRPALDSFEAFHDRCVKMPYKIMTGQTSFQPLPMFIGNSVSQAEKKKLQQINSNWKGIQDKCAAAKENLAACDSDESCGRASIALQKCVASVVCPSLVSALNESMERATKTQNTSSAEQLVMEEAVRTAFTNMTECIHDFELDSRCVLSKP